MRHATRRLATSLTPLAFVLALAGATSLVPAASASGAPGPATAGASALTVYVGTYTDAGSRGIYRFTLDTATGAASAPVLAGEAKNPSFLALHPSGRFLYAVDETDSFGGKKTGAVSAFAVDPKTGDLTLLNQQASEGGDPCHLVVDRAGRNVLVANYGGGTVAVLPIGADGRLAKATSVQAHRGSGPNKDRQEKPHAHGIYLDASERHALAPDLGADRVFVYRFDASRGTLEPQGAAPLEPGSGPRHLAFDPAGRHVYVIDELASTITAFGYDATKGVLETLQTVPTLPAGFNGASTTAEVALTPDGRWLYGSNRGHDSLAVFSVAADGRLTAAGHFPAGGREPRHFAIDPSGRFMLVAHQDSDSITVFRLDGASGRLSAVGAAISLSKPVCVLPVAPVR
ncbi:MAG: lactonase family protein [Betaproteobacteria bacterium]